MHGSDEPLETYRTFNSSAGGQGLGAHYQLRHYVEHDGRLMLECSLNEFEVSGNSNC